MASQTAQIISNFGSQVAATSGSGLRDAASNISKAIAGKQEYQEKQADRKLDREIKTAELDKTKQQTIMDKFAPTVHAANTPEKWAKAQQGGFITPEMKFEDREPFLFKYFGDKAIDTVEVGDPTSPTGTKLVPKYDAAGQPGKPKSGTRVDVDKDGNVTFQQGTNVTGDLTKPTLNKVQQKLLDKGDIMSQITAIKSGFKPEYQQVGTRMGFAWDSMRDKFADTPIGNVFGDLNPEEGAALQEYTDYRAAAAQNFSTMLNDISGVAVNPTEFKRAEAWLPNPGSGVFDGDSPAELESKINRMETFTRNAMMKYSYTNKHGLSIDDVDVKDMPSLMNDRGEELMLQYSKQGLNGDVLMNAVKQSLADEFGISRD